MDERVKKPRNDLRTARGVRPGTCAAEEDLS